MGRKKRKVAVEAENEEEHPALIPQAVDPNVAEADPYEDTVIPMGNSVDVLVKKDETKPAASGYAMTSHSAEIVEEDIYVSDGSEDEEGEEAEVALAGSRLGIMRRGLHHPLLVQPTRNWKREENNPGEDGNDGANGDEAPVEDDLSKLDPAQRAARLLQEKQRKLEEAKETARRVESEENAGRDPCLFSKRTAFDIRMDQIEDKPWTRGAGDMTDFFNYAMTEEDWLEYSKQQLTIRNELSEASRQQRAPDPTIVPVKARTPSKQTPKVAVKGSEEGDEDAAMEDGENPAIGPSRGEENDVDDEKNSDADESAALAAPQRDVSKDLAHVGTGGAWGAGAAPGSTLARLIEEQEKNNFSKAASHSVQPDRQQYNDDGGDGSYYGNNGKESHNYYGGGGGGGGEGSSSRGGGDNNTNYYNTGGNDSNYYGGGINTGDDWGGGGGDRHYDGPPRRGGYSGGHQNYGGYGNFRGGDRGRGRGRGRGGRSGGYDHGYNSRKRGRDEYGGGRGGWGR